jgi:hypothetical protein
LTPIPVAFRTKVPTDPQSDKPLPGWERFEPTPNIIDRFFPAGKEQNIAVLNGKPSGNHVDVDLDTVEARLAAPLLLPATGWVFGRKSSPRSHWIYRTDLDLETAQEKYTDLDGTDLLELRGSGGITVHPPSTHKDTGERIEWSSFTEPAQVRLDELQRAVRQLAAAVLLAWHWPTKGSRDETAMALAGGLVRAGWAEAPVSLFIEAVAVAAQDEEARMRAGKAAPAVRKLEEDKQVTGWPRLAELLGPDGKDVVRRVREWLGLTVASAVKDPPVCEATPWPEQPGEEAFYGLAGRIVRAIEPASEADPTALLMRTLVSFGSIVGRAAWFNVESSSHYGNEFAVLVGRTSKARKGTSWNRIHRLTLEAEEQWANERVQTGLSSGEGLIWAVRDPIMKRERVKEKGEVRYEEVEADPGVCDKRLLVYEPEYANVLKQTERQGNTLSAILRQAWDGANLRTMTKNSPARSTGAHVSRVGHITADELRRYLTLTESANGFGNRHLWLCVERSKVLPEGGRVDPGEWEAARSELTGALDFAKEAREVGRDEEAWDLWRQMYAELSDGKPGLAGALLARAEAHVMRLALLYALLDRSQSIRAPHLLAGLALWDFCDRSVRFVFGDSLGDAVADELLRLLRSSPNGLTRTDSRDYFQRHAPADRIGSALGLLLQHNLARREQVQTGGRPTERWHAVTAKRR